MIFTIIGVVAVTIVAGYIALGFLMLALMQFGGFDEFNPIGGIVCTCAACIVAWGWWALVGTHITLSLSFA